MKKIKNKVFHFSIYFLKIFFWVFEIANAFRAIETLRDLFFHFRKIFCGEQL